MALPEPYDDGRYPTQENGYPFIYYAEDGGVLCPACVNGENGSVAHVNGTRGEDAQWNVIESDVHWEGPPIQCDHCGKEIESAYGDPEEEARKEAFDAEVERCREFVTSKHFPPYDLTDPDARLVAMDYLMEQGFEDEVARAATEVDGTLSIQEVGERVGRAMARDQLNDPDLLPEFIMSPEDGDQFTAAGIEPGTPAWDVAEHCAMQTFNEAIENRDVTVCPRCGGDPAQCECRTVWSEDVPQYDE